MLRTRALLLALFAIAPLQAAEAPVTAAAVQQPAKKVVAEQARVEVFAPQGEVHPVRQVQVRFSEAITRVGDLRAYNPFTIGCAVPGKGRWVDGRNWVYDFERDLPAGIACQFVPVKGLRAASGKPVAESPVYRFHTGGPSILDARPYRDSRDIDENQVFLLKFDGENDRRSLVSSSYCLIENIKEKVPLRFLTIEETRALAEKLPEGLSEWWADREGIPEQRAVACSRALPPGARVKVVFAKGLASATGVRSTAEQVLDYKVRAAFSASFSCTRENARQGCAPMMPMRVEFTEVVGPEFLSAIRLEAAGRVWRPQANSEEGAEEHAEFSADSFTADTGITFAPPFPPETAFTLVLPAGVRDTSGRALTNAARFPLAVRTANYPPLAKFSASFGVIEAAAGAVPLTLRNLEPGGGVTPEARLFTLRLPESDTELLKWLGRFQRHQNDQSCFNCGRRDEKDRLIDPDPRSRSLLAANKAATVQTLPRALAAREFEVIGLPVGVGAYVHEVESRYLGASLIENKAPMYVSALSIVTNLGVHLRTGPQGGVVWVTRLDKGTPVPDADVAVHDCKTGSVIWRGKTDAEGLADINLTQDLQDYDDACMGRYAVIARSGNDRAIVLPRWDEGIETWRFNLSGWNRTGNLVAHSILDRTLLRAGETVHMRHVVRGLALDDLRPPRDPRYKRLSLQHQGSGQEYELPLNIDSSGNGDNEWKIPRSAKLGRYVVRLEAGDSEYELATFRVEEFRLPVLKARLQIAGSTEIAPASLPVDMQLNYLNGGAYPGAPVTLRGRVSPRYFSSAEHDEYSFRNLYQDEDGSRQPVALEEQALTLDAKGGLRVESSPLPTRDFIATLMLEMEYRDPSGETHTATASTALWPAGVIAGVKLPGWISTSGNKPQPVDIITLGVDGKVRPNVPVQVSAELRSHQSHRRRTVGGFYAYESVMKKVPVAVQCGVRTGRDGKLSCTVTPTVSGELVVKVAAADEQGRRLESSSSTWVSSGERWWFDQGNDDRIDLLPEKKEYQAGDSMKLQVRMPFPEATALVSIERDGIIERHVQKLSSDNPVINLPVKAEYAPNVFVSALIVRGRNDAVAPTALVDLGKPAFKLGIAEVKVGWEAWRLGVAVKTDKARYQPREKAEVAVQVTPPAGQALPAGTEVTLAAVDEALLELSGNDTWDVLTPMMQSRGHDISTATSQLQVVGKRHYGRKALPPGGGGGRGGATRELFDTLVYWQARAKVDADGRARFTVPLSDSLTGFHVVAVATSNNRFGSGSTRMESFQEISVLSGLPLVVRQGDRLDPAFTVRNAGDVSRTLTFSAALTGKGVLLQKTLTLAPGSSETVAVPFVVPADVESLEWLVSVEGSGSGSGIGDRLKVSQRVLDPVPERALQGSLMQLVAPVEIPVQKPQGILPGGALQVSGQARLADSLGGVKEYFRRYPYSCLEQKVSRAAGLQERAQWDDIMDMLPAYLDDKGLAAFYPGSNGYPFLTAYLLRISRVTGWPLPEASRQRMLDGLVEYLEGRTNFDDWRLHEFDEDHRRLEVITLLAQYGRFRSAWLDTLKIQPARWTTAMLVNWLELLRTQKNIPQHAQRLAQAESVLRSRLTLQGTAYLLSEGRYVRWWLYENDEATVARLMLATMDLPAWREDQPRLLRGLLMRQQGGHWETTVANLWGVQALRRFSEVFESETVAGQTQAEMGAQKKSLNWNASAPEPLRLDWPEQTGVLKLSQEGSGKPWITVQSRARLPLQAPVSTGFTVGKTLKPLQQKIPGQWSVGDVVQVQLALSAQSDIGWVALDDPIPAGSTLLGRALGRDSSLAADSSTEWTWATYAEFGADSYRAYYERIYKGEWKAVYTLRLNQSGDFRLPPTRVEAMYAPEMFGMVPNGNWVVKP